MNLTGKCKEDFEKWFVNNGKFDIEIRLLISDFYLLPQSMQYGVYVDFFDSYDMFIYVVAAEKNCGDFAYRPEIIGFYGNHYGIYHTKRQQARKQAIEKANEIYNKL